MKFETLGELSLDDVLPYVVADKRHRDHKRGFEVNGHCVVIKMHSQRYNVFKQNNVCVGCGIVGSKFLIQRQSGNTDGPYHLNLYAVAADGTLIMMTKDHIIPVSKGGKDHMSNYQTMCINCNALKKDKI